MEEIRFLAKKAGEIMTHGVVAVDRGVKVVNACIHMVKKRIRSVLVLSNGEFKGIVTASDIISKVLMKELPISEVTVGDIMTSPLITIDYDSDIEEACQLMVEKKVRHLPVVRNGEIVGMVTPTDILRGVGIKD